LPSSVSSPASSFSSSTEAHPPHGNRIEMNF
jgi:hypothetical protein